MVNSGWWMVDGGWWRMEVACIPFCAHQLRYKPCLTASEPYWGGEWTGPEVNEGTKWVDKD